MDLQWRTDGEPLWSDHTLFADPWAQNDRVGLDTPPPSGSGGSTDERPLVDTPPPCGSGGSTDERPLVD
ncbi:hypothetical protein, partial [Nocardioides sp. NPDC047086]|uniref:hypothetical protein n=1 Tax=Nocardioides sp. NPDC047086 TaxID=3154810 RepID=UPI003401D205